MTNAWWETRWLLSATAWTIAGLGALAVIWAMCRDRSRGRTRCPKCWYDLAGLVTQKTPSPWPITCPECGKKIEHERQTRRTRRHWRLAALALAMMLAAYPIAHIADAREYGPQRLLPLWLQAVAWPVGEVSTVRIARSFDDLEQLLSATGNPVGRSPFGITSLMDIRGQLNDEAPSSWYHRVFAWRLAHALRFDDPTTQVRVYCYDHLWDAMRRESPWYSKEKMRELDNVPLRSPIQFSRNGLYRTKEEWICEQSQEISWMLAVCACAFLDECQVFTGSVGSSIIFACRAETMERLDRYSDAFQRVALASTRARIDVPMDAGYIVSFRNVADVLPWGFDGHEKLLDAFEPLKGEWDKKQGANPNDALIYQMDISSSVLIVIAVPEFQRIIDAKIDELRAERAKELQRARGMNAPGKV